MCGNNLSNVGNFNILGSEETGLTSFSKNNSANYRCRKTYDEAFRGIHVFEDTPKNVKLNLVLVVVHILESTKASIGNRQTNVLCWKHSALESVRLHFLMWQRLERNYRTLKWSKIVNRLQSQLRHHHKPKLSVLIKVLWR